MAPLVPILTMDNSLNPYDLQRIAGGSTGGGATAVSAFILPIAIGSDTAASIRVPAPTRVFI